MVFRLLLILSFGVMGCRHDPWTIESRTTERMGSVEYRVPTCSSFLAQLSEMPVKELKIENDKVQKALSDKKSDDYPRASLIAGVYQAKTGNYSKAIELLSPLGNRKTLEEPCRLSVRLYSDLLSDLSQMEKELASEKKQKGELERKLKALSDIEKEISQRETKAQGLR